MILQPAVLVLIAGAALRIVISEILGSVFLSGENMDDVLLLSYAALRSHFLEPNVYALCKTLVFPVFLDIVHYSHLSYHLCLALLYILSALVLYCSCQRIFKKTWLSLAAYLYFLFIPLAFDYWCGLRVYRNAIIPPVLTVLFSMLVLSVYRSWFEQNEGKKALVRDLLFYLALGFVFFTAYYIREDGIWILACVFVFLLAAAFGCLLQLKGREKKAGGLLRTAFVLLPFLVFFAGTAGYKAVNRHFFGVAEIETRMDGEQGKFFRLLFRIDSEERSSVIWLPADVLDQAYGVSETLQTAPELREGLVHHENVEYDLYENPVPGEGLTWLMKNVLVTSGFYQGEAQTEAFFRKVNAELEAAFSDGRLKEAKRIQILGSSGGFTKEEIFELTREMRAGLEGTVLEKGYLIGAYPTNLSERLENRSVSEFAANICNEPEFADFTTEGFRKGQEKLDRILRVYFPVMGAVNAVLFVSGIAAVFAGFIRLFKKRGEELKKEIIHWLGISAFYGIGFVYLFGISWYSHFIWGSGEINTVILNFYLIALPVIWMFGYLLSIDFWCRVFRREKA